MVFSKTLAAAVLIAAASAQVGPYDKGDLGVLSCPSTTRISGNTGSTFNIGQATGPGPDHWWRFSLDQQTIVTLDACGSWFDSAVGFYNRGVTEALASGVGNCANGVGGTVTATLEAGEYSMIVEGVAANDRGPYSGSLTCELPGGTPPPPPTPPPNPPPTPPPTTSEPTPSPTPPPTPPPAPPPTTSEPSPSPTPPPTPPPTPTPPPNPLTVRPGSECPDGYGDYGTRFDTGFGRVTVVTTHAECAARCTQYSGAEYSGGCRAYQTGMYFGLLYCRSYGGPRYSVACASWAFPTNPGYRSGALNTIIARTGQMNVGGSCCTSNAWLLETGNAPTGPIVEPFGSQSPTTSPKTPPPTPPPTRHGYCPVGYADYGVRFNQGLGKITVVDHHAACADRCTQHSDPMYNGGCKGYMTGMYFGLAFCRTYTGSVMAATCAPWAVPGHKGAFSGEIGTVHQQTGQTNIGGNCCTRTSSV